MGDVITPTQYYTLCVILASISCSLSFLGSFAIIISSYRRMVGSIYQRLIFMISFWDALGSFMNLLHWHIMPQYTQQYGLYLANGNTTTCTMAGYAFYLFPMLVSFYSFYLSIYFYGKIKYNLLECTIKQNYMIPAHVIALSISLLIATMGLFYNGYKPRPYWNLCLNGQCVIGVDDPATTNCATDGWGLAVELLFTGVVTLLAIASAIATIGLYNLVRHNLQKNTKYHFRHHPKHHGSCDGNSSDGAFSTSRAFDDNSQRHSDRVGADDGKNIRTSRWIPGYAVGVSCRNLFQSDLFHDNNSSDGMAFHHRSSQRTTTRKSCDPMMRNNSISHGDPENAATATATANASDGVEPADAVTSSGGDDNNTEDSTAAQIAIEKTIITTTTPPPSLSMTTDHPASTSSTLRKRSRTVDDKNRIRLLEVRNQGIMYVVVYINSFCWVFFKFVFDKTKGETDITIGVLVLSIMCYAFFPIQGFLNFLVYTTPRYKEFRKKYPHGTRIKALYLSLTLEPASDCMKYFNDNINHHRARTDDTPSNPFRSRFVLLRHYDSSDVFRMNSNKESDHDHSSRRHGNETPLSSIFLARDRHSATNTSMADDDLASSKSNGTVVVQLKDCNIPTESATIPTCRGDVENDDGVIVFTSHRHDHEEVKYHDNEHINDDGKNRLSNFSNMETIYQGMNDTDDDDDEPTERNTMEQIQTKQ